jgi:hypothetical protein
MASVEYCLMSILAEDSLDLKLKDELAEVPALLRRPPSAEACRQTIYLTKLRASAAASWAPQVDWTQQTAGKNRTMTRANANLLPFVCSLASEGNRSDEAN